MSDVIKIPLRPLHQEGCKALASMVGMRENIRNLTTLAITTYDLKCRNWNAANWVYVAVGTVSRLPYLNAVSGYSYFLLGTNGWTHPDGGKQIGQAFIGGYSKATIRLYPCNYISHNGVFETTLSNPSERKLNHVA